MKNFILVSVLSIAIFSCQISPKNQTTKSEDIGTGKITNNDAVSVPESPKTTAAEPKKIEGIDISHFQVDVEWEKIDNDKIDFVFIKATGGLTYVDPSFTKHWSGAKKSGIIQGAYHFYYTKDDPTKQANFFVSNVLPISDKNNLPPVIDIESDGVNSSISKKQLQQDIQTFLAVVEKEFDRKPILYTSHTFAQEYFDNPDFAKYYLWIAEYDVDQPTVPTGWLSAGWVFWQNSPSDTINGIPNAVDHNVFNGDMAALKSL